MTPETATAEKSRLFQRIVREFLQKSDIVGLLSEIVIDFQPNAGCFIQQFWNNMIENLLERASALLTNQELVIAGLAHRINEIEIYHHSEAHPDPFCHRSELQFQPNRWCFHRQGSGYRGGSFKGLDLTWGAPRNSCGVLIRTIELPDSTWIEGPSLVVDYVLKTTGKTTIRELDEVIQARSIDEISSPLHLRLASTRTLPVYRSARVGLSLKHNSEFRDRPYRLFVFPDRLRKAKKLILKQLISDGKSDEEIHHIAGSSLSHIHRCRSL